MSATTESVRLDDGSECELAAPEHGNGYLVTQPDLWDSELDRSIQAWLLDHGYATMRHSRDVRAWDVARGLTNEDEGIRRHAERFGTPSRGIIAWGGSMGGLITRLLIEQRPGRYVGAIPMDGGGAGTLATFNRGFDMAFIIATLLETGEAPAGGDADAGRVATALRTAAETPEGRARLALAAAVGGMPVWTDPALPAPDPTDLEECARHLARGLAVTLPQASGFRLQLERVVGGAIASNTGIDYGAILRESGSTGLVRGLYDIAGLSLSDDLSRLAAAPRTAADPEAVSTLTQDLAVEGRVSCPTLVLKSLGDPDAVPDEEHAYAAAVERSGGAELVRWAWVHTPGHLNFTLAERLAALTALVERIESGRWGEHALPRRLNERAARIADDERYDASVYFAVDAAPGIDFGVSRFVAHAPRPYGRATG